MSKDKPEKKSPSKKSVTRRKVKQIDENPSKEFFDDDDLKKLEDALGAEKASLIISQVTSVRYRGPLPPSSEFSNYESTVPGAGQQILDMAKAEQSNRHDMMNRDLDAGVFHQLIALIGGIVLVGLCVAGAVYLAAIGQSLVAAALVGVTIMGVIMTIVRSKPSFSGYSNLPEPDTDESDQPSN